MHFLSQPLFCIATSTDTSFPTTRDSQKSSLEDVGVWRTGHKQNKQAKNLWYHFLSPSSSQQNQSRRQYETLQPTVKS